MTEQVSSLPLKGVRVLVATPGCPSLDSLPDALQALGAQCLHLCATADFSHRDAIEASFSAARNQLGAVDALVLAVGNSESRVVSPFAWLEPAQWRTACLEPLRTSRQCLQAAWHLFDGCPASIVVLGPNLSLTGAPGLVALSVLSEGQRALMKSAARQWGAQGIRLNWVGVESTLFAAELADAKLPVSPELGPPPPALGAVPSLGGGVADTISLLISANAVTGASVPVDGGLWMVP